MTISQWLEKFKWVEEDRKVVAYHGTNVTRACKILSDHKIWPSRQPWDWIGHGIYFWEYAPHRAWEWARGKFPADPAVVGVSVRLGKCLDLTDTRFTLLLQLAFHDLKANNSSLPKNVKLKRELDCLVINHVVTVLKQQGITVDSIRAPFIEGKRIYSGASFHSQSHIQLCICTEANVDWSTAFFDHGH